MSTPKKWIDTRATAELLDVSTTTLKRWRLHQVGPAWRRLNGGGIRYHYDQVLAWVAEQPGYGEVA
jgi:hypothetical protein